jgi:hypothetical protein
MDPQLIGVLACVALAAAYLAHRMLRIWRGKGGGCGGKCNCGSKASGQQGTATFIPLEQVSIRLRDKE